MRREFPLPDATIEAFCARHRIRRLSLFGSVLTDRFGPESDVDLLVEFEPDARVSLFRIAAIELELGALLGRKVDLRTPQDLSRFFRDEVSRTAAVVYAA
ncbi:MAG TPA: nucleotidyltransferase domain-containing protein [Candidatus Methanoperedens sp.]|nr:nucleotidyltransferase domain-containing protein [Candidatus Methanoperedens sp.]